MTIRSYLICATPRSGSTLLCDLLGQTSIAGRPNSFYRTQSIATFCERWHVEPGEGLDFERRYLAAAIREGSGDTGMFGMRLHALSLFDLLGKLAMLYPAEPTDAARLSAAFGTPLYIRLSRKDKIAQAISRTIAEQSGLWHRNTDGAERERVKPHEAPVYDGARLRAHIAETAAHEAVWDEWARGQGITPFEISYEELSANPRATLAKILIALGRDPVIADKAQAQTARLADATSKEWAARYRAETSA
jgi:LPS sulfotransferase NodH